MNSREKNNIRKRQYYLENREAILVRCRKYYQNNKKKIKNI